MNIFIVTLYINTNIFLTLTEVTTNVGSGTHMLVDMHLHVLPCLQRHVTVQSGRRSWWNLWWLPSVQVECEDCFCKLCLALLLTDSFQGAWDRATVVAKYPSKLFCPRTPLSTSWKQELYVRSAILLQVTADNFLLICVQRKATESLHSDVPSW
jgi:hypothetical protein